LKGNYPVTFCHNDTLGPNLIYDKDTGKICFVDYEYASLNYRGFDIANHFCEYAGFELDYSRFPSKEVQLQLLTSYLTTALGQPPSQERLGELYDEVTKCVPLSHLLWGLWGFIQSTISTIEFDYFTYGIQRLQEYFKVKSSCYNNVKI